MLALTACAASPKVEQEPTRVEIPVIVPCVKNVPIKPEWSFEVGASKNSPLAVQVDALLDEREQRAEYEAGLEAVITGCK
jgi:hypothetical protein